MTNPEKSSPTVREALQAIAKDYTGMKKSAIFRAHYQDIENALSNGHNLNYIIELFNRNKISFTLNTFKKYLQRERKKRLEDKPSLPAEKKNAGTLPLINTRNDENSVSTKEKSEVEMEPAKEWKSAYSKNDPRAIDEALSRKIDLDALAKAYKEKLRKGEV